VGQQLAERIERVLRFMLVLHVALMPLALGGREPWGLAAAAAFLSFAWAAWLVAAALRGKLRLRGDLLFLVPVALLAMAFAQLIPNAAWTALGPANVARWQELSTALGTELAPRLCLAPAQATDAISVLVLTLAFAFLAYQLFGTQRGLLQLALAVVAAALLNAILGYATLFEAIEAPYGSLRGGSWSTVMAGTFWNRNHFGELMVAGAIHAVGIALAVWFTHLQRERKRPTGLLRYLRLHWQGLVMTATVVALALAGAELLSLSRAAFLAGTLAFLLLIALAWCRRRERSRLAMFTLAFFLLAVGGGQATLGKLADRFDSLLGVRELTLDGRIWIWRESLVVLKKHWLAGIGPEAFNTVSPRYEGPWKGELISLHAHNDWLELLIEYGLPLGTVVLTASLVWLVLALRRCWHQSDPLACWLGCAAGCSLIAVALHSLADYPLRSPGMLTVASAAAVLLALASRSKQNRVPRWRWRCNTPVRLALAGSGTALAVLVILLAPGYLTAGRTRAELRDFTQPHVLPASSLVPASKTATLLADQVLDRWPGHAVALTLRGTAQDTLALAQWRDLAAAPAPAPGAIAAIEALLRASVADLQEACRLEPCNGRTQVQLATSLDHLYQLTGSYDEVRLRRLYDVAAAGSPSIASDVFLCANGFWESWQRTGAREAPARQRALALFAQAIRLEPSYAAEVLQRLGDAGIPPSELRAVVSDHLLAHEALYAELERQLLYDECLAELDALADCNEARFHQTKSTLFTSDITTHSLPPTSDVADSIARRRVQTLGMLGRWQERNALLHQCRLRGDEAGRERLAKAAEYLAADCPLIALPLLERVRHHAPDLGEPHIQACRALQVLDRSDDALAALLPLVYRTTTDFPVPVYRAAAKQASVIAGKRLSAEPAPPFAEFLRLALAHRARQAAPATSEDADVLASLASPNQRQRSARQWSQAQLIPYYLGLVEASRGETAAAAAAFAQVLAESPRNLPAARQLLKLPSPLPDAVHPALEQARALTSQVDGLVPLVGELTPWLRLLGFRLRHLSSVSPGLVELSVMIVCTGQPKGSGQLDLRFSQGPIGAFGIRLDPTALAGDIPTWRVGQTIALAATVNLHQLSARARYPLKPGPYALTVGFHALGQKRGYASFPPISGLAFRVDPRTMEPTLPHD
jgi:O-antigen ligase/tetratricopeptide (TPR) repeat protein